MSSAQQDQLGNGISTVTYKGVLLQTRSKRFRRFQRQAVHQKAVFPWPAIARVLSDSRCKNETSLFQIFGQRWTLLLTRSLTTANWPWRWR